MDFKTKLDKSDWWENQEIVENSVKFDTGGGNKFSVFQEKARIYLFWAHSINADRRPSNALLSSVLQTSVTDHLC